jgi:hypothetical protein
MHAYLGATRSHEGLDMDMHDMLELHPLVAVEDAVVRVVRDQRNGCIILESRRQPGVYYIYQHANGSPGRCFVAAGQRVARGERLAYAWGDGRWGHLHFAMRLSDTEPPYAQRFNSIVNAFPQCYELWHGDLAPRPRVYTTGHWRLHTANYWETRNQGFRSGFDEIVGYGWRLGAWCPADVVECESEPQDRANPARSLRLRTTLHEGLSARATNPEDHYDFVVCVPNGQYGVRAVLGDLRLPTRQHVAFNGEDVGTYDLAAGTFVSTPETRVCVSDGRLVVRIGQADAIQYSAISELHFAKTDGHAS